VRTMLVGHDGGRAGAPRVFGSLVRWLHRSVEWDIEVVFRSGGELADELRYAGIRARDLAIGDLYKDSDLIKRLARSVGGPPAVDRIRQRQLSRARPSLAGTDLAYLNSVPSLQVVGPAPKVPIVLHCHELAYAARRSMPRAEQRWLGSVPAHYVACATCVADFLVSEVGVPASRVDIVSEFIDPPDGEPCEPGVDNEGRPMVLGCGNTEWRKGVDLFLQLALSYARLPDVPPARFVWLGGKSSSELRDQILFDVERVGLTGSVRLEAAAIDPAPWFAHAAVFVLTSREDPFPLVGLEAAAAGRPIVCFERAGGMPELVGRGAGLVVPYLDIAGMAQSVRDLLASPATARELGQTGRRIVLAEHLTEVAAPRIKAIIEKVHAHGAREGP
jgi:glycosyltransferase involved in cell wall biosynthesis